METGPRSKELSVQRLRYQFRMSGYLKSAIRSLFIPETPHAEVFFYSTRHVLTDDLWTEDVNKPLELALSYFSNIPSEQSFLLDPSLHVTEASRGMTRISLRPSDQALFDQVVAPLGKVPGVNVQAPVGHYYEAHIRSDFILPDMTIRQKNEAEVIKHLRDESEKRYYSLRRLAIVSDEVRIPHPPGADAA